MKRLRLVVLLCMVLLLVGVETASAASCGGCIYRVRRGDSLWRIARRHGTTVKALVACNSNIKNPRIIVKGQRIRVPCNGNGGCACSMIYRVKRGDTLSEIAYWHGTTVRTLVRCNSNIHNPRLIHKGRRICIP